MIDAVIRNGTIVPIGPLPSDWQEGTVVQIEKALDDAIDVDAWAQEMNELCADSSEADEAAMRKAIEEHRRLGKEQMRREMGLE